MKAKFSGENSMKSLLISQDTEFFSVVRTILKDYYVEVEIGEFDEQFAGVDLLLVDLRATSIDFHKLSKLSRKFEWGIVLIIEQSDATIYAIASKLKGDCAIVSWPSSKILFANTILEHAQKSKTKQLKAGKRALGEYCILIVEDNELNINLERDLLEAHGYRTILTRNGIDAIALARLHRPDLIVMDIQLPGVSGLDVTKWMREDGEVRLRHIPIVAVTAFAMKGDNERILRGGCDAYVSKPLSVSRFLETIRLFLPHNL